MKDLDLLLNDASRAMKKRDFAIAEDVLKKALKHKPDSADIYYKMAVIAHQQNMLDKAALLFKKTAEFDKNDFTVHNNLGVIFYTQQKYKQAEKHFRKALKINPVYLDALAGMAKTLHKTIDIQGEKPLIDFGGQIIKQLPEIENCNEKQSFETTLKKLQNVFADHPEIKNRLAAGQYRRTQSYTLQSKPVLATFCGPNDIFLKDIEKELAGDFEIRRFKSNKIDDLEALMKNADAAFFEWCEPLLVHASKLPKRCPIICRIHGYEVFGNAPEQVNWAHVDKVVFVADHKRKIFNSKVTIPAEKQILIRNGIDLSAFTPAKAKKNTKKLVSIGYINYRKGFPMMLQFFHELLKTDNEYSLYIRGDHQDARYQLALETMINELELQNKVFFVPWVENLNQWLSDKSHVLSFSLEESFHYAIGNGMAAGLKPVVHAWTESRQIWPKEAIFRNLDEFLGILHCTDFEPLQYRHYLLDKGLDLKTQCESFTKLFMSFVKSKKKDTIQKVSPSAPVSIKTKSSVKNKIDDKKEAVCFQGKQYQHNNELHLLLRENEIIKDYMNLLWKFGKTQQYKREFLIKRLQSAFHTILGSYFNAVTIPEYDKNIVLRICQMLDTPESRSVINHKDANEAFIMHVYMLLANELPREAETTNVKVEKKYDPSSFPPGHEKIKALFNALKRGFHPLYESGYVSSFIVHGSMATLDYTFFSDVDTQLFLSDAVFADPKVLRQTAMHIAEQNIHLKLFDPIQHHGYFISTDMDCNYYPQAFLPVNTLKKGVCLLGNHEFNLGIRDSHYENCFALWHTGYYFRNTVVSGNMPTKPFDIKRFLSRFMMLPVFYLELFQDVYPYKKDSFEMIRAYMPENLNHVMDVISMIRVKWNPAVPISLGKSLSLGVLEYAEILLEKLAEEFNA